jgi:hypothetical protein
MPEQTIQLWRTPITPNDRTERRVRDGLDQMRQRQSSSNFIHSTP